VTGSTLGDRQGGPRRPLAAPSGPNVIVTAATPGRGAKVLFHEIEEAGVLARFVARRPSDPDQVARLAQGSR